jgi:SprT protein
MALTARSSKSDSPAMTTETSPRDVPDVLRAQSGIDATLKLRARRSLLHWLAVARAAYGQALYQPTLSFDLAGTCAGIAYGSRRHIRLNPQLLAENIEHFESDIIPHELAHLLVRYLHGEAPAPHGQEWQAVMHKLGVAPNRLHDLDTATSAKVYGYACSCNADNWLSSRQHARAMKGAVYACLQCKGPMLFQAVVA